MSEIKKAIIPAAGLAKRMRPLSNYLPKAMLPLGTKPVLSHLVDEIRSAGIREILIVCRSEHCSIRGYFDEVEDIHFLQDDSAGGPGQAVLQAESFAGGAPVLIVYSDAPLLGRERKKAISGLCEAVQDNRLDGAVLVYPVPAEGSSSRGVVSFRQEPTENRPGQICHIEEKPESPSGESAWATACRYAVPPEIFEALKCSDRDKEGELQLTTALNTLIEWDHPIGGCMLPEGVRRYDTGNFEDYFDAFSAFADREK